MFKIVAVAASLSYNVSLRFLFYFWECPLVSYKHLHYLIESFELGALPADVLPI